MRYAAFIPLVWLIWFQLGCRTVGSAARPDESMKLTAEEAGQLAHDATGQLADVFSPGSTTFTLTGENRPLLLRNAVESELRRRGYGIGTAAEPECIRLVCVLDTIGDDEARLSISAGDGFTASRLYVGGADTPLEPVGVFARRTDVSSDTRTHRAAVNRAVRSKARVLAQPNAATSVRLRPTAEKMTRSTAKPAVTVAGATSDTEGERKRPVEQPAQRPGVCGTETIVDASSTGAAASDTSEDLIVLVPSPEGVIEISSALFATKEGEIRNPFVQEYRPKTAPREFTVRIAGVVLGPQPSAVLNDRVCSVGERLDGFRVVAIARDMVALQWEHVVLHLPVGEEPVMVRYP